MDVQTIISGVTFYISTSPNTVIAIPPHTHIQSLPLPGCNNPLSSSGKIWLNRVLFIKPMRMLPCSFSSPLTTFTNMEYLPIKCTLKRQRGRREDPCEEASIFIEQEQQENAQWSRNGSTTVTLFSFSICLSSSRKNMRRLIWKAVYSTVTLYVINLTCYLSPCFWSLLLQASVCISWFCRWHSSAVCQNVNVLCPHASPSYLPLTYLLRGVSEGSTETGNDFFERYSLSEMTWSGSREWLNSVNNKEKERWIIPFHSSLWPQCKCSSVNAVVTFPFCILHSFPWPHNSEVEDKYTGTDM